MANTCNSLSKSLAWCQGTPVLPGIRRRLYYIDKNKIGKWPTLVKNDNGQVTSAKYDGNFTIAVSSKWDFIDVLVSKSGVTSEPQGEAPSQTQLNKLVAVYPGVDEDATLLASVLNNGDHVFLVQTADGKFRVLGSEMYQTKCTVNQDLGQGETGNAATTINVEATDIIPAPFYEGTITTSSGDIFPGQTQAPGTTPGEVVPNS